MRIQEGVTTDSSDNVTLSMCTFHTVLYNFRLGLSVHPVGEAAAWWPVSATILQHSVLCTLCQITTAQYATVLCVTIIVKTTSNT